MVDIHAMIEGLNSTHRLESESESEPEDETQALSLTAQAALEDLADQHRNQGATLADITSYLVHLAIQAARNIAP